MKDKAHRDNVLAIIGIIFFIFLAIASRSGSREKRDVVDTPASVTPSSTSSNQGQNDSVQEAENLELFPDKNYHFTITVVQNGQTEIIDGNRDGNKQKFSVIGSVKEEYAKISENYLKLENGSYSILNTEIRSYFPYLDLDQLEKILQKSFVTEQDGISTYEVDILDLLDFYTNLEYSGFDELDDDQVKIYKNTKSQVYKIEMDYSNYFSYQDQAMTEKSTFQVTMEFDRFGEIQDLDI